MAEKPLKFTQLKAYEKLKKLANNPIDLSKEGSLTPKRLKEFSAHIPGFKLLYGTERIDESVFSALAELADETHALKKMKEMQEGVVINKIEGYPSEDRQVLHTAMRDFFDNKATTTNAKNAADLEKKELDKLNQFLIQIDDSNAFTDLVQIGIGGSDLGPRALYIALEAYKVKGRQVHFVSNVDPDDAYKVFKDLDLKKTLVVVVSKSGSTLETLTNEELAKSYFIKAGLNPKDHFVAVTGEKSPLDDPNKYLQSFYMWDFIGGRYSATSMVGGVMLGFGLGFDNFKEILRGAHFMDQVALKTNIKENLPLLSALIGIWNRNFLNLPTVAIIPYSQALLRFPAHLQQCNMESNGKHIDKLGQIVDFETGPVIWGEPGTNGQHSFYQLIHQGTEIVPLEFIGFKESQYAQDLNVQGTSSQEKLLANLFAQSIALAIGQKSTNPNKHFAGNRPNRILLAKKLDPYTMGALLSYFENTVAFQGFIWNINSFDQEGVQLGKVLAGKIIDIFKGTKDANTAFPLGKALVDELDKI